MAKTARKKTEHRAKVKKMVARTGKTKKVARRSKKSLFNKVLKFIGM